MDSPPLRTVLSNCRYEDKDDMTISVILVQLMCARLLLDSYNDCHTFNFTNNTCLFLYRQIL